MALYAAALDIQANALKAAATHAAIHTANPGTTGANPSAAARKPITWGTTANGDFATTASLLFTGGTASGPALFVGLWTALTGGTCLGYFPLTGDQAFNSSGEYTITSMAINGDAV